MAVALVLEPLPQLLFEKASVAQLNSGKLRGIGVSRVECITSPDPKYQANASTFVDVMNDVLSLGDRSARRHRELRVRRSMSVTAR